MFGAVKPDIILQDRDDQPIGVVEVKSRIASRSAAQEQLFTQIVRLSQLYPTLSFGLLVDPEEIDVFRREAEGGKIIPAAQLKTREILSHYCPSSPARILGTRAFNSSKTSW